MRHSPQLSLKEMFNKKQHLSAMIVSLVLYLLVLQDIVVLALPPQTTITTGTLNNELHFDRIVRIGATVSRSSDDMFARPGAQLWGGFELFSEWVNREKGGIVVGNERWGVEVIEVADESNITLCNNAARELVDVDNYNVSFLFGPFSSSLTKGVIEITDAAERVIMCSGSSYQFVWDGTVQYGFGLLYKSGTFYKDTLPKYASLGAKTGAYLCNLAQSSNTCASLPEEDVTYEFTKAGIEMKQYHEIDTTLDSYSSILEDAVESLVAEDVDIVVVHDFSSMCIDLPKLSRANGWTPKALFLVICNNNIDVRETMGTDLYYAGSYAEWYAESGFVSNISGYSTLEYKEMYENEFNHEIDHFSVTAFAGGEILVAAMEMQALIDPSKCLHSPTISDIILHNNWSTIKSETPIVFSNLRQAEGAFIALQYGTDSSTRLISTEMDLVYPMPSWDSIERTPNYVAPPDAVNVEVVVDAESSSHGNSCELAGLCDLRSAVQLCLSSALNNPVSNCTVFLPERGEIELNSSLAELSIKDALGSLYIVGRGSTIKPSVVNSTRFLSIAISAGLEFHVHLSNFSLGWFGGVSSGGVIYAENLGSSSIEHVRFENNWARKGGAMYLSGSSNLRVQSSSFVHNVVMNDGGAVFIGQGNAGIEFLGCLFGSNAATDESTGRGGAIFMFENNDAFLLSGCEFQDNWAFSGGAAFVDRENSGVTVEQCEYVNNTASSNAGALYFNTLNTGISVSSTLFVNNMAANLGGAVVLFNGNTLASFVDVTFARNSAFKGTAVFFNSNNHDASFLNSRFFSNVGEDGTIFANSNNRAMIITSCVFSENFAKEYGAAMYFDSNNHFLSVQNSEFVSNAVASSGIVYLNSNNQDGVFDNVTCHHNLAYKDSGCISLVSRNFRFTLRNSLLRNNSVLSSGGAFHSALMNSELNIVASQFINCSSGGYGGAVYIGPDHDEVTMLNSSFVGNFGKTGGAAYFSKFNIDISIDFCSFAENSGEIAAGVFSQAEVIRIRHSEFSRNQASSKIGALYVEAQQFVFLKDLVFSENIGNLQAGSMAIVGSSNVMVEGCQFLQNVANEASAVYVSQASKLYMSDSRFWGNVAAIGSTVSVMESNDVTLTATEFHSNIATEDASGVSLSLSSVVNISDCSFVQNVARTGDGSAIHATESSDVWIVCNLFDSNLADSGGGTVFWSPSSGMPEPMGLGAEDDLGCSNQFVNNTALYGRHLATEGVRIRVAELPPNGRINVTDYSNPIPTFSIELLDYYEQVALSQDSDFVDLSATERAKYGCYDSEGYLAGQVVGSFSGGIATFSSMRAYCAPRSNLTVVATTSIDPYGIELNTTFDIFFRDCKRGEYYGNSICIECEEGSFSIQDPKEVDELSDLSQLAVCQRCGSDASRCFADQIYLKEGFWRRSETNVKLLPCPMSESSCIGGNGTGAQLCAVGHEKSLCAVCSQDYFMKDNECVACETSQFFSTTVIIFMIAFVCVIGGVGCYFYYRYVYRKHVKEEKDDSDMNSNNKRTRSLSSTSISSRRSSKDSIDSFRRSLSDDDQEDGLITDFLTWFRLRYSHLVVEGKIFIATLQVVVSASSTLGVSPPESFREFSDAFTFVQLSLTSMFPLGCSGDFTVIDALILQVLAPIAMSVVLLIAFFIHYRVVRRRIQKSILRKKGDKARAFAAIKSRYFNLFLYMTYIILPAISTSIFRIFLCTNVDPDGEDDKPSDSYMTEDLSISCDSNYYKGGVVVAAIGVCLYPVGIPLLYWYVLSKHRNEIQSRETIMAEDSSSSGAPSKRHAELPDKVRRLSFLWEAYTPDHWYWEIIETSRRLVLTAVLSVISPRTSQQAVLACIISLLYIKWYNVQSPYNDKAKNRLAEVGQYQIYITFFCALILQNSLLPGEKWETTIGIVLILVNMGVFVSILKIEYDMWRVYKASKRENKKLDARNSVAKSFTCTTSECDDAKGKEVELTEPVTAERNA